MLFDEISYKNVIMWATAIPLTERTRNDDEFLDVWLHGIKGLVYSM